MAINKFGRSIIDIYDIVEVDFSEIQTYRSIWAAHGLPYPCFEISAVEVPHR